MHMADALLSPAVGGGFLAASGGALAYSARRLKEEGDDRKIPLMGVLGAFVFAAQMINFTIPGTGSSGHLGGGMLLAMLLGPFAGLLTMASVLIVQALIFADGGLLALGANIWNMGVYPCFVGWAIYRGLAGKNPGYRRLAAAAVIAVMVAVELGAASVAVETVLSGKSDLPFGQFSALMVGIHLPIALVEGMITIFVVKFIHDIRPEIVQATLGVDPRAFEGGTKSLRPVALGFLAAALVVGGIVAWFASTRPDGLEWSILRVTGTEELRGEDQAGGLKGALSKLQGETALLAGYRLPGTENQEKAGAHEGKDEEGSPGPIHVSGGTSLSGIVGSLIVLLLVSCTALVLVKLRGPRAGSRPPGDAGAAPGSSGGRSSP